MDRERFDHVVRAAAAVLGETELLVIGSQAVHAATRDPLFEEAERSVEVDVAPFDDPDGRKADLIDGSIGEASMFHESFGIYARGQRDDRCAAAGLARRLVRYTEPVSGTVAWCLEVHDLWVSKAIAGRVKDREFCDALLRELVDPDVLRRRVDAADGATPGWSERRRGSPGRDDARRASAHARACRARLRNRSWPAWMLSADVPSDTTIEICASASRRKRLVCHPCCAERALHGERRRRRDRRRNPHRALEQLRRGHHLGHQADLVRALGRQPFAARRAARCAAPRRAGSSGAGARSRTPRPSRRSRGGRRTWRARRR